MENRVGQGSAERFCSLMALELSPISAGGQAAREGALSVRVRVGSGPGTAGPVQGPRGRLDACCTLWGGLGGAGRVLHSFKAVSSGAVNFSSSPAGVAHRFIHDSCGFFL